MFCGQFLASRKEGYTIVDWMTSSLAISIVGPMSSHLAKKKVGVGHHAPCLFFCIKCTVWKIGKK